MNCAPPSTSETLDGGFKVVDSTGQTLAYVYGHATANAKSARHLILMKRVG